MLKSITSGIFLFLLLVLPRLASAQLYDVRSSSVNHDRRERSALKVQVDGTASDTRDYFQEWMKDSYKVRFKSGGIAGFGKSGTLTARQTPASTISGKLVDLYATVIAPTDSTAEIAVFGGFDDNTFFDEQRNAAEFSALRALTQNFANAARLRAYRAMIAEAEKKLRDAEKEKAKLERSVQQRKDNTISNLNRIEDLKRQNIENTLQQRQDSVQLLRNTDLRKQHELLLQRRRARLSALDRKN